MKKKTTALSGLIIDDKPTPTPKAATPAATETSSNDKKKSFPLKLTEDQHKKLKLYAVTEDTSMQKVIIQALELFYAEKGI